MRHQAQNFLSSSIIFALRDRAKNGETTTTVVSRDQTTFSAPLNHHRPIRRRAPTGEEEVKGRKDR